MVRVLDRWNTLQNIRALNSVAKFGALADTDGVDKVWCTGAPYEDRGTVDYTERDRVQNGIGITRGIIQY